MTVARLLCLCLCLCLAAGPAPAQPFPGLPAGPPALEAAGADLQHRSHPAPRRPPRRPAAEAPAAVSAPWPNPARTHLTLSVVVPADGDLVEVGIYDLVGRRVRTILRGRLPAGRHAVVWDLRDEAGRRVEDGVYFVQASLGRARQIRRLLVLE